MLLVRSYNNKAAAKIRIRRLELADVLINDCTTATIPSSLRCSSHGEEGEPFNIHVCFYSGAE